MKRRMRDILIEGFESERTGEFLASRDRLKRRLALELEAERRKEEAWPEAAWRALLATREAHPALARASPLLLLLPFFPVLIVIFGMKRLIKLIFEGVLVGVISLFVTRFYGAHEIEPVVLPGGQIRDREKQ